MKNRLNLNNARLNTGVLFFNIIFVYLQKVEKMTPEQFEDLKRFAEKMEMNAHFENFIKSSNFFYYPPTLEELKKITEMAKKETRKIIRKMSKLKYDESYR